MQPQHGKARLEKKTLCTPDTVHIILDADWMTRALPGQFAMVRIHADTDPLLRRPIRLCAVTPTGIELLFKIRGTGTECMSSWNVGHSVDIIGPLGNGFTPPPPQTPVSLIAGGIGIAPLICFARWLLSNRPDCDVRMYLGTQTSADIDAFIPFIPDGCKLQLATEDGSRGKHGFATDMFAADAASQTAGMVYGCGPMPMLKALADLTRNTNQQCQISLEAHMACGIGACLGCTVPSHSADNPTPLRVCADGPVFDARQIFPQSEPI